MNLKNVFFTFVLALFMAQAVSLLAADTVSLYLTADGIEIKGDNLMPGQKDSIMCLYYEQSVGNTFKNNYGPIVIRKLIDKSSPLLIKAEVEKQVIKGVFKFFQQISSGSSRGFYRVSIEGGHIDSIKQYLPDTTNPATNDKKTMEEVVFSYSKITFIFEDGGIAYPSDDNSVSTKTSDTNSASSNTMNSATGNLSGNSMSDIHDANRLDNIVQKPSASTGQADITGLWMVTQENEKNHHLYMYQEGGKISGVWDDRFMITGSMSGNVYTGKYFTTVNPSGNSVTMTMASDGLSFVGTYHRGTMDHEMRAIKDTQKTARITATPTMGTPSTGFAGTWGTTEGDIALKVDGTKVSGTWGDKTVIGTVNGNVLNGRYYKTSEEELLWGLNMTMKSDGKTCVFFHTKQGGVSFNTWRK